MDVSVISEILEDVTEAVAIMADETESWKTRMEYNRLSAIRKLKLTLQQKRRMTENLKKAKLILAQKALIHQKRMAAKKLKDTKKKERLAKRQNQNWALKKERKEDEICMNALAEWENRQQAIQNPLQPQMNPLHIPEILNKVLSKLELEDLLVCRQVSTQWKSEATKVVMSWFGPLSDQDLEEMELDPDSEDFGRNFWI